ncbi:MAG: hypothetical protein GY765_01530, partial [bacterium]|nr:hypothetical protein [bacterium]
MKKIIYATILICLLAFSNIACNQTKKTDTADKKIEKTDTTKKMEKKDDFKFLIEQFADVKIGRFQISGFESLPLKQKELIYYLYEAAMCGRDMMWDQNYKHNLRVRRTL